MRKIIKLNENQVNDLIKKILNEQTDLNELDYESYKTSEGFQPLRDALKKNQTVSVVFVKKDGTVRPMAIRRSLKSHVFSTVQKTDAQKDIQKTYDLKRFIDINAYIRSRRELGDSEAAAKISWRTVPLQDTLGFLAGGHFYDVRDENEIRERFGEEIYNSLTANMVRAVEAQQAQAEADLDQEEPAEPAEPINENMRKVVKLSESQLQRIIKKIVTEQYTTPRAYMNHWEHKFLKSVEILLDNGYQPNDLIKKIEMVVDKKQLREERENPITMVVYYELSDRDYDYLGEVGPYDYEESFDIRTVSDVKYSQQFDDFVLKNPDVKDRVARAKKRTKYFLGDKELEFSYYWPSRSNELYDPETDTFYFRNGGTMRHPDEFQDMGDGTNQWGERYDDDDASQNSEDY